MYYFEGDYKTGPEQNFSGARRLRDKAELINFAQDERRKREECRERHKAATIFQKVIRGFLTRRKCRKIFSSQFDRYKIPVQVKSEDVLYLVRRIPFLDHSPLRVLKTSQLILDIKETILNSEDKTWIWRLKYLVVKNLYHLQIQVEQTSKDFVHFFTNPESLMTVLNEEKSHEIGQMITYYAVSKNYFQTCFSLIRNPSDFDFGLKIITRPFDIKSQVIYDKFCSCLNNLNIDDNDKKIIILLINEFKKINFDFFELHKSILKLNFKNYNPLLFLIILNFDTEEINNYLQVEIYFKLFSKLTKILKINDHCKSESGSSQGSEESEALNAYDILINECITMMNQKSKASIWLTYLKKITDANDFSTLSNYTICLYNLYLIDTSTINQNLIYVELFRKKSYIKYFWICINNLYRHGCFSDPILLIKLIINNIQLDEDEIQIIIPLLTVFSVLMKFSYTNMTEDEFLDDNTEKPFKYNEMINLSKIIVDITMGVILIAYPDIYTNNRLKNVQMWSNLLKELVDFLSLLKARDSRCNMSENHWISNVIKMPDRIQIYDPTEYISLKPFTCKKDILNSGLQILSIQESRTLFILNNLPFTVQFLKRFTYLQTYFEIEKFDLRNAHILQTPYHFVRIRRDYIYEDAFKNLTKNEDFKNIKVQMVNSYGLEEAGVDGGGVFREFITLLLKTSFDPTRGFFVYNNDNQLYPNPSANVVSSNYLKHFYFIGRILAKAIFEGVLLEIRLTEFFLSKLTGITNLHLTNLSSLDPELYKNIINLQKYQGDMTELGLDFSIFTNEFGKSVCKELKPNGTNIQVTSDNVSEYIELVAKFKMHYEILEQTDAFMEGIGSVFSLECLKMFTPKELQIIISGDEAPIDIDDMKQNTLYAGGFHHEHPSIIMFWNVVTNFNSKEKSDLLKFITSYSRPPLLGFKELHPHICIQKADGINERLPTSSTCMHLLKLPAFSDENVMKEKLLYAIKSGAGFELS